ncbi:hypothetical protein VNO77_02790 [Canavalia gladiata]|uniref:Uncharacterized protein n=1 Tax=Canavalia gladiata TaxID=3824 RepID=A0AAN9MU97_CANGL
MTPPDFSQSECYEVLACMVKTQDLIHAISKKVGGAAKATKSANSFSTQNYTPQPASPTSNDRCSSVNSRGGSVDQNVMGTLKNIGHPVLDHIQVLTSPSSNRFIWIHGHEDRPLLFVRLQHAWYHYILGSMPKCHLMGNCTHINHDVARRTPKWVSRIIPQLGYTLGHVCSSHANPQRSHWLHIRPTKLPFSSGIWGYILILPQMGRIGFLSQLDESGLLLAQGIQKGFHLCLHSQDLEELHLKALHEVEQK